MAKLQVFERTATHHNKGFQVNAKMLIENLAEFAEGYTDHTQLLTPRLRDEAFA